MAGLVAKIRRMAALGAVMVGLATPVVADQPSTSAESLPPYTPKGADTCLKCHDETAEFPVLSIFKTPHAVRGDRRTPFAGKQCEACHGPGAEHAKRVRFGRERPPIPAFGDNSIWSTQRENELCLGCHRGEAHLSWQGSAHERQDLSCSSCHTIHAEHDPVMAEAEQPEVCFECHTRQRGEFNRASAHPVRQEQMDCTSCHEPHGSLTEAMLSRPTLNESCYECHAQTRGPFLWEHAPVTEDCTLCHRAHGSNHPSLLTRRPPLLCQQCHARAGHPSIGRTGDSLPSGMPSGFLLGGSCLNCHSQVHGSNHPSGANLSR